MTPPELLRHLRASASLSRRELAERVGCSPSHVLKAEGEGYGASLYYLLAVAEACGVSAQIEIGPLRGPSVSVRLRRAAGAAR